MNPLGCITVLAYYLGITVAVADERLPLALYLIAFAAPFIVSGGLYPTADAPCPPHQRRNALGRFLGGVLLGDVLGGSTESDE